MPTRAASFAVAIALGLASWLLLARVGAAPSPLPPQVVRTGSYAVGVAFVLRAIGEFRFVGFFKRVRGTRFARWDSFLFSPLCLALGLASLRVASR